MQQSIQLAVALLAAEIGYMKRHRALTRRPPEAPRAARMSAVIGHEKCRLLCRRKMADLEDCAEVLCRYRNLIGRARNLADEAAILANGTRQAKAHARGAIVEHRLEDALVGGHSGSLGAWLGRPLSHRWPPRPKRRWPACRAPTTADSPRTRGCRSAIAPRRSV